MLSELNIGCEVEFMGGFGKLRKQLLEELNFAMFAFMIFPIRNLNLNRISEVRKKFIDRL